MWKLDNETCAVFFLPVSVHRCCTHFQPSAADVTNTSQLIALLNKSIFLLSPMTMSFLKWQFCFGKPGPFRRTSGSSFFIPVRHKYMCGKQNTALFTNIFLCIGWIIRLKKTPFNRRQFLCLF